MKLAILPVIFLLTSSVHATNVGMIMLRDAALLHDDQRIRSLIHKQVQAEQRGDFQAVKQAIGAIGKETDPPQSH